MNSPLSRSGASSQTFHSPDGRLTVRVGESRPIGRGGPTFSRIRIPGHDLELGDRQWGEPLAFSPDSRCLALVEFADAGPPICKVVVFDFKLHLERTVLTLSPGMVRGLSWSSPSHLEMKVWTLEHEAHAFTWSVAPGEPQLPWWRFWKRSHDWRRMNCPQGAQRVL